MGSPMDIYRRPANAFVAQFVGSPAMTLASGTVTGGERHVCVRLRCGAEVATLVPRAGFAIGDPVQLGLRCEHVAVTAAGQGSADAEAILVERLGDRTLVYAQLSDGQEITAQDVGVSAVRIGDRIGTMIMGEMAHVFAADGTGHHPET
jgi:multiple sugar transport system ATP-binding protein